MQRPMLSLLTALGLLAGASGASAGTIVSTINGNPTFVATAGAIFVVDTVITFGPTPVGGVGAGFEISFDAKALVSGGGAGPFGGASTSPAGWIDVTGGSFTCSVSGFCENVVAAGVLFGGASFGAGATFALPSITVDTTAVAPGIYPIFAAFSLAGPDAILASGGTNVTGEYTIVPAFFSTDPIPEPGTGLLLALGLASLGVPSARRRPPR